MPSGEREVLAVRRCDGDPPLSGEASTAAREVDLMSAQPLDLAVVLPVRREPVAPAEDGCTVDHAGHRLGGAVDRLRRPQHLPAAQECLARHARPVRAVTADQLALDDRAGQTSFRDAARDVLAGRPGTDDDDVVLTVAIDQGHGYASGWLSACCGRFR